MHNHEDANSTNRFANERIEIAARLWSRTFITLIDVRNMSVRSDHPLENYRMPSSMLIYAVGKMASVKLNHTIFNMDRFAIFHGGKGTKLSVMPSDSPIDLYMVLYKAEPPSFYMRDVLHLLEQINPFVQLYGYSPQNPIWFADRFRQMLNSWQRVTAMNQLHAKNILLQLIYAIYTDLEREGMQFMSPDPVTSAKRYLDEHYAQPIQLQELAEMFAISSGYLTRLFKKREGKSLQAYLMEKRLAAVRHHLLHTDTTIKEIAAGCGFADEINLFRMFKKHYKMTPSDYRKINTVSKQDYDIDNHSHYLYNENGLDKLAQFQRDGELAMFGQKRSKEIILAAAMSLVMLLSACGSGTAANTNGTPSASAPTQTAAAQATEAAQNGEAAWPRTYVDATGSEVVIEKQPERVAVLHFAMAEIVYALGAPIIAAPMLERFEEMATLQPLLRDADIVELGAPASPDLEKLLESDPELILGWANYHGEVWDSVGQIAPIVDAVDASSSGMTLALREHGKLLGREEKAEQLIADINSKLAAAREQLSSLDETVVALSYWENGRSGWIAYKSYTSFYNAEEGLGLKAPEKLLDSYSEAISVEGLAELNPDHIFIRGTQDTFDRTVAELAKSEVWNTLTAVRNNQVYPIEESTYNSGPLGIQLWADYAVETLLK